MPIDAQVKNELEPLISVHCGTAVSLCHLEKLSSGVNRDNHFFCETTTGERFGLKFTARVLNALDNEKLLGDIAALLQIENACKVQRVSCLASIPEFQNKPVNITSWVKSSKTIGELTPQDKDPIQVTIPPDFAKQLGEWSAFGLLFGISDRHLGNFVWSVSAGLSMIDLEDAFHDTPWHDFGHLAEFIYGRKFSPEEVQRVEGGSRGTMDIAHKTKDHLAKLVQQPSQCDPGYKFDFNRTQTKLGELLGYLG